MNDQLQTIVVQEGTTEIKKKQIYLSEKAKKLSAMNIASPYSSDEFNVIWRINPDVNRQLRTGRLMYDDSSVSPLKWIGAKNHLTIDCSNLEVASLDDNVENYTAKSIKIQGCYMLYFGTSDYYYYGSSDSSDKHCNKTTESIEIDVPNSRICFKNWLVLKKVKISRSDASAESLGYRGHWSYSDSIHFNNCPNLEEIDITQAGEGVLADGALDFRKIPLTCKIKFNNKTRFRENSVLIPSNVIVKHLFPDLRNNDDLDGFNSSNDSIIDIKDLFPAQKNNPIIEISVFDLIKAMTIYSNTKAKLMLEECIAYDNKTLENLEKEYKQQKQTSKNRGSYGK